MFLGIDNLLFPFLIDLLIPFFFFAVSAYFKTGTFVDLSGNVAGSLSVIVALLQPNGPDRLEELQPRQLIAFFASISWSMRVVALNAFRFIKPHKSDLRFSKIKESPGKLFVLYFGQFSWTFIIYLPVYINVASSQIQRDLNNTDWFAFSLWLAGYFIVTVSEEQKAHWKRRNPGKFINIGMWSYSRHPNALGECIMWIGLTMFCLTNLTWPFRHWIWIPVVAASALRFYIMISFLESSSKQRYGHLPEYDAYCLKTSLFICYRRRLKVLPESQMQSFVSL
jgi:steroid 5-alpha reductase family enzyme